MEIIMLNKLKPTPRIKQRPMWCGVPSVGTNLIQQTTRCLWRFTSGTEERQDEDRALGNSSGLEWGDTAFAATVNQARGYERSCVSGHMPETQNWPPGGQAHKKFPFLISFYFILLIFWHFRYNSNFFQKINIFLLL